MKLPEHRSKKAVCLLFTFNQLKERESLNTQTEPLKKLSENNSNFMMTTKENRTLRVNRNLNEIKPFAPPRIW